MGLGNWEPRHFLEGCLEHVDSDHQPCWDCWIALKSPSTHWSKAGSGQRYYLLNIHPLRVQQGCVTCSKQQSMNGSDECPFWDIALRSWAPSVPAMRMAEKRVLHSSGILGCWVTTGNARLLRLPITQETQSGCLWPLRCWYVCHWSTMDLSWHNTFCLFFFCSWDFNMSY